MQKTTPRGKTMSQAEAVETKHLEPNLKEYTEEEISAMVSKGAALLREGKDDEAMEAISDIPIMPEIAQGIKEDEGMDYLIEYQYNLSEAVKKYGKEWLYS